MEMFLTTVPAYKPIDEMSDSEIIDITYRLIDGANIAWKYLYFGIESLPVDKEDSIQQDGYTWYRDQLAGGKKGSFLKWVISTSEYTKMTESWLLSDNNHLLVN